MSESGSVCMSCLETNNIFNIFDTHECEGIEEVYADMLQSCFDISISKESNINGMCERCILTLRSAYYFKQNVVANVKVLENGTHMKIEHLEDIETNTSEENYLIFEEPLDPDTENSLITHSSDSDSKKSDICEVIVKVEENDGKDIKKQIKRETHNKTRKYNKKEIIDESAEESQKDVKNDGVPSSEEVIKYVCDHCEKCFYSQQAISRHLKTHLEGPFPCLYCDKVFSKLNTRNSHTWRVHQSAAYACAHCPRRYPTFHARLRHLRARHADIHAPVYPCPYCDNIYYYAGARSKHIRCTHLRVHNHSCAHCKMAFFKRRELLSHMASVHDIGEKKYKCPICSKCFYRNTVLKHHVKQTHMKKPDDNQKYVCNTCSKTFTQSEALIHLESHTHAEQTVLVDESAEMESVTTVYLETTAIEGNPEVCL